VPDHRYDSFRRGTRRRPAPNQWRVPEKPLPQPQASSRVRFTGRIVRPVTIRNYPLQAAPPRQRFLPTMMHAPYKEGANRSLRQARRRLPFSSPAAQPGIVSHRPPDQWSGRRDAPGNGTTSSSRVHWAAPSSDIRGLLPSVLPRCERSSPRVAVH
jgi:hypothetical protein